MFTSKKIKEYSLAAFTNKGIDKNKLQVIKGGEGVDPPMPPPDNKDWLFLFVEKTSGNPPNPLIEEATLKISNNVYFKKIKKEILDSLFS